MLVIDSSKSSANVCGHNLSTPGSVSGPKRHHHRQNKFTQNKQKWKREINKSVPTLFLIRSHTHTKLKLTNLNGGGGQRRAEMWSRFDAMRAQLWVDVWVERGKKKRILNYMNSRAFAILGAAWKFPTTFIIIRHEIDGARVSWVREWRGNSLVWKPQFLLFLLNR